MIQNQLGTQNCKNECYSQTSENSDEKLLGMFSTLFFMKTMPVFLVVMSTEQKQGLQHKILRGNVLVTLGRRQSFIGPTDAVALSKVSNDEQKRKQEQHCSLPSSSVWI